MIKIFKTAKDRLEEIREIEKNCWVNFSNPSNGELIKLSEKLNIPLNFLTDPLDIDERARIEIEDKCVLIVLRVSHYDDTNVDIPYDTLPIGIIFVEDLVITVSSKDVDVLSDFVNGRVKNFSTESRSRFLLQIFLRTALLYLKHLKEINKKTNTIEDELAKAMKNEELIKLLNLEKSLVFFTTSLKSNELMMERLQKTEIVKLDPDDKELLEDVLIENKQAIEMSNVYSNILSGMMDAFASVISNNLNVVLKFLTAVTIILMIPTFIASLYGMNIRLPFQDHPYAFLITLGISFTLALISTFIFIKRKWF
jgi:magnesium transporter